MGHATVPRLLDAVDHQARHLRLHLPSNVWPEIIRNADALILAISSLRAAIEQHDTAVSDRRMADLERELANLDVRVGSETMREAIQRIARGG